MIGSLRGVLLSKKPYEVIVEAAGVGYRVAVPLGTLSDLPAEGSAVFLHVHTHVRDDAIQLFGFSSEQEKGVFTTLLGVTGIGPKVALNIISGISHDDFLKAVESEDVALLSKIPGLGKKTAHRIVLELKGKLSFAGPARDRVFDDTLSALVNLGYRRQDALESLEKAWKKGYNDIETLLRESLKNLTGAADGKA
ncbi:MAG: Holliday junction branch migration protein RuvA [Thermodesulfovibrionales bacterium]